MQFDNQKTRNVADVVAKILAGETVSEELKGNQHKIDANKNNKVDAHDFELLRAQKEKEKANSMKYGKQVKEETGLTESHFKVGDTVKCKASGMKGEVIKLDKEHGEEDDKYYTVKREDGKTIKYAPNELSLMKEAAGATKEKEEKFHKDLDTLVHKTFGKRKEEMKEEAIDEAMFPGTKEYQKKYGESPQQKLKKTGDKEKTSSGEMEKTASGVKHTRRFSEMVDSYKDGGLKYIATLGVKEEASQEEYEDEVEKAKAKSQGKDKAEVAKASVQAVEVQKEQTHTKIEVVDMSDPYNIEKREIDLEEREMTDAEMKKREEIVKSMKKGMQGFKDRYGDRAKNVMYATATKQAMKD